MFKIKRWLPAIILMVLIFIASATPSTQMPDYGIWDKIVKKSGHTLGYALLGLCYMHGFKYDKNKTWLAWVMAVLYAASDEFHQSFVPGRQPSLADIFLFDGIGAAVGLLVWNFFQKRKN